MNKPSTQLVILFALFLVGSAVFYVLYGIFISIVDASQASQLVINAISPLFIFALPVTIWGAIAVKNRQSPSLAKALRIVPFTGKQLSWTLLLLVACGPLYVFLVAASKVLIESSDILYQLAESMQYNTNEVLALFLQYLDSIGGLLLVTILVALIPAITEELFFRSGIHHLTQKIISNVFVATLVSGLVFAAMHIELYGFMARWMLGCLLGFILVRTGSIWPCIIIHFVFNAMQVVAIYLIYKNPVSALYDKELWLLFDSWTLTVAAAITSTIACWYIIARKLGGVQVALQNK